MTRKQLLWAVGIGLAAVILLVAAYGALPVRASWTVNRILHHVWQGVTGLAGVGGVVWVFWPRPKAPRRDLERERVRRRMAAVVGIVLTAVAMVVLAEVRRDWVTREKFLAPAIEDLRVIKKALDAYAADYSGSRPEHLTELVLSGHLARKQLYYTYRDGPREAAPPSPESVDPRGRSYYLVPGKPRDNRERGKAGSILVFLRAKSASNPPTAWAPLTVVLDQEGRIRVASEDIVERIIEEHFPTEPPE